MLGLEAKTIKHTILKNTLWLSASEAISRFLKLILVVYVARVLGAVEYGKFTFSLNLVTLLVIFADFGLGPIVTREFSKSEEKEKTVFPAVLSLKTILGLLALAIMLGTSFFITSDIVVRRVIWVLSIFILIENFASIFYAVMRAHQKMEYEAISKMLQAAVCTGLGLYFLFSTHSIVYLGFAYLASAVFVLLFISLIYQLRFSSLKIVFQKSIWKQLLSLSWPLALVAVFSSVYHSIDSIMLGAWGMMKATGLYNAAYRIVDISVIPMVLVSTAFFPVLSKSFGEGEHERKKNFFSQLSVETLIGFAIFLGGIILAPQLIHFIYGAQYQGSVLALQILMGALLIMYLNTTFSKTLIAANLQKIIFKITFAGAILNVILNLILIPRYSLYGAAAATLITYFAIFLAYVFSVRRKTNLSLFNRNYFKVLFSGLLSGFLMYVIISYTFISRLNVILAILIGAAFYLLSLFFCSKVFRLKII